MSDPVLNFLRATVLSVVNNNSATFQVSAFDAGRMAQLLTEGEYNLVIWNSTDFMNPIDDPYREIIRVTDVTDTTVTIDRPDAGNSYLGEGDENTAQPHNIAGKVYMVAQGVTKRTIDELQAQSAGETFETVSKNLKAYDVTDSTFTSSEITITYDAPGGAIIKTISFSGGLPTSIVLSGNTPGGIQLTKSLDFSGGRVIPLSTYS